MIRSVFRSVACIAAILLPLTASAQQSFTVVVDYPGLNQPQTTLDYPQPIRLNTLLADATNGLNGAQFAAINWSAARLGSDKLNQQFAEQRRQLDSQLTKLETFWQQRSHHEYRNGVNYLRRQLNTLTYRPAFYMGLQFERSRIVLQENPFLTSRDGNTFYLRLPTGAIQQPDVGLDKASRAAGVNTAYALAPNGDIAEVPAGLHNSNERPRCRPHRVSRPLKNGDATLCQHDVKIETLWLLHEHATPAPFQGINQQIAETLKFAVGGAQ